MKIDKVGRIVISIILTIITFSLFAIKTAGENNIEKVDNLATTKHNTHVVKAPEVPQVLLDIMWCESRNDQSKINLNYRKKVIVNSDGSTTTTKIFHSRDIGLFQINEKYHADEAKKLGIDIYTTEGNTKFALLLYNKNGTKDWLASKPCWSNIEAWKSKEKSFY